MPIYRSYIENIDVFYSRGEFKNKFGLQLSQNETNLMEMKQTRRTVIRERRNINVIVRNIYNNKT